MSAAPVDVDVDETGEDRRVAAIDDASAWGDRYDRGRTDGGNAVADDQNRPVDDFLVRGKDAASPQDQSGAGFERATRSKGIASGQTFLFP
jgi:hypothetical protein